MTIGGTEYMGVGGQGDVSGSASDLDEHCPGATAPCPCTCENPEDQYDNINNILWTGNGNFDPVDDWDTVWTAPDSTGSATLRLKVQDDGFHYQDLDALTEVASQAVEVVYPDGVSYVSGGGSLVNCTTAEHPNSHIFPRTIVFQWLYQGNPIPTSVGGDENPFTCDEWATSKDAPVAWGDLNWTGNWLGWTSTIGAADCATGEFQDPHPQSLSGPLPPSGKWRIYSIKQQLRPTGTTDAVGTFGHHKYIRPDDKAWHSVIGL